MSTVPVLAIAGRIDSGKSSVAAILSERLDLPVLSFGHYVRSTCAADAPREQLQQAGSHLLATLGPDGLLDAVLAYHGVAIGQPAIWEGVRHRSVLIALRSLYRPLAVELVLLRPSESDRLARAAEDAGSVDRLATWESHPTENLAGLGPEVSLEVTAADPALAAAEILAWLSCAA